MWSLTPLSIWAIRERDIPTRLATSSWVVCGALFAPAAEKLGFSALFNYVLLPGIAAMVAGGVIGDRLLQDNLSYFKAAALGIWITVASEILFAGLFSLSLPLSGHTTVKPEGLLIATLTIGSVVTAPFTFPAGALAGVLFVWIRRKIGRKSEY